MLISGAPISGLPISATPTESPFAPTQQAEGAGAAWLFLLLQEKEDKIAAIRKRIREMRSPKDRDEIQVAIEMAQRLIGWQAAKKLMDEMRKRAEDLVLQRLAEEDEEILFFIASL